MGLDRIRRLLLSPLAVIAGVSGAATAAGPAGNQVDLQLVLAVDISGSMDYDEQRVQRDGYVEAFRDPQVINAITDGLLGRIAVTFVEWSDADIQFQVTPWMIIDGKESAFAYSAALAKAPLHRARSTSISGALLMSMRLFDQGSFQAIKKTIDVSGDGANNNGPPVTVARDQVLAKGISINGLPIMIRSSGFGANTSQDIANLDQYYRDCVIGGPSSFLFTVDKLEDFPVAIRRKLIQEIAFVPPQLPPAAIKAAGTTDCMIGEKLRRGGFGGFGGFDFTPGGR
ncbi:MAG: DUF1194 domain-containing protein [Bauldia sp.]